MLNKLRKSLVVLFTFIGHFVYATDDHVIINDLRDDWLVFDSRQNIYVPFVDNSVDGKSSLSFPLNLKRYKNYNLYVKAPPNTSILFNQQLIAFTPSAHGSIFNIDSLSKIYHLDNLLVTLYNPEFKDEGQITTAIVGLGGIQIVNEVKAQDQFRYMRRNQSQFSDFFITGIIIILLLYAIVLNVFTKKLHNYYNLNRALSLNIREEFTFKGKIFDGANIPIIIVHSFLIAFIGITMLVALEEGNMSITSYGVAMSYWAILAIGIFIFFILKYWLLLTVGILFKLPFVTRHYLEYLRISIIFFTALFLILIGLHLGLNIELNYIGPIVINVLIGFVIMRVLLLYFKFIQSSSFNNLYLFSYLCSTEILPMVVGLKILLNK